MIRIIDIRRISIISTVVVATLALFVPSASGHAAYSDSDPPDEGTVSAPPSEIWAEFTEPLSEGSYLKVYDPCGRRVDHGDYRISAYRIYVSMSAQSSGTYRVDWFAISAVDPHSTRGNYTFTSTGGDDCAVPVAAVGNGGRERSNGSGGTAPEAGGPEGGSGAAPAAGSAGGAVGSRAGGARSQESRRRGSGGGGGAPGAGEAGFAQGTRPSSDESPPPWEGLPMDGVLIGVLLAIVIGAAGGKVYAGILGPRR